MMDGVYNITPHIKNYTWGSLDSNSWVGRISNSIGSSKPPFAEAWYGDHKNGPALVNNKSIETVLNKNLDFLGKILSISKPLSIQLHPDEVMARKLHLENPEEFKDQYAKEEGAVALSPVEIAHSLLNNTQIRERIKEFPELLSLLSDEKTKQILSSDQFNANDLVKILIDSPKEKVSQQCKQLWFRIKDKNSSLLIKHLNKIERLYPEGDVGVFILMLMNILRLEPGEAIYTPTGCPHAYLDGELIEIMKPSDNVLRCGLTDKKIDSVNFLKCLKTQQSTVQIIKSKQSTIILGNMCIEFLSSGSTIFTSNKPKIVVSLDAKGELSCTGRTASFNALSSFLVTENKTIDIKIDSGRIISFGNCF